MGVNFNPLEVIKNFSENKFREKESVYEYISKTAIEVSNLASIWEEVVRELNMKNAIGDELANKILEEIGYRYIFCNSIPYSRLMHFYRFTSRAIGGKVNSDWLNTVIYSLAEIIEDRNITKQKFEEIIRNKFENRVEKQNQ